MRFVVLAVLVLAAPAAAQDKKEPRPVPHSSPDFRKCRKCLPAYEKAVAYVRKNLGSSTYPVKMIAGWLFLADGRYGNDLEQCIKAALQWETARGNSQHAQNWYPALAGMLLVEYYKYAPTANVAKGIQGILAEFEKTQERTGGWFKWFEGAYKDRLDYAVKDLGILDAIIFGFLWSARIHGFKVNETMLLKADKCLEAITSATGIGYGTGSNWGEKTGARGAFAMLGLEFAQQTQHKIWKTYTNLFPRVIPTLPEGHHVGGLHALGQVLGCRMLGPKVYDQMIARWLDHYIDRQDEEGGVYIGDDGDAGGEKGLFRGNTASTASFALMILLQDPKVLRPPPRKGKAKPPTSASTPGGP